MHPTRNQQIAIRTLLNTLIDPDEFRLGMRVERLDDGILYVFVSNEDSAGTIEANYSDDFALVAEQVFNRPIRFVNVLPMEFSNCRH